MKKITICSCLCLFSLVISGQTKLLNSEKKPIPFVEIKSSKANIHSISDLNGTVDLSIFDSLDDSDSLYLKHVAYLRKSILKKDFIKQDSIILDRKKFSLPEVEITDSRKTPKFQKFNVCFRGFQSNNGESTYYIDGTSDLVTKTRKYDFDIFLNSTRTFKRREIKSTIANHKVGIDYTAIGLPYLRPEYIPSDYIKAHKIIIDSSDSCHFRLLSSEGTEIGQVDLEDGFTKYSINDIFSRTSRSLLNTEVNWLNLEIILIFQSFNRKTLTIEDSFDNIVYSKFSRYSAVKHDKETEYIHIRSDEELFVNKLEYINHKPDLEYTRNWGLPKSSSFSNEFWKNCDCEFYYPLHEKQIGGLELVK